MRKLIAGALLALALSTATANAQQPGPCAQNATVKFGYSRFSTTLTYSAAMQQWTGTAKDKNGAAYTIIFSFSGDGNWRAVVATQQGQFGEAFNFGPTWNCTSQLSATGSFGGKATVN